MPAHVVGISVSQDFEDLYNTCFPALYRRALAITKDAAAARDIVQEAFTNFIEMRKEGTLRNEASPCTLLYRMVTNGAFDWLRGRARWTGSLDLGREEDFEGDGHGLEVAIAHRGDFRRLEAAQDLALLTEEEEEAVVNAAFLHFVDGLTLKQVGQLLGEGKSPKDVAKMLKAFVRRARARQERFEGTAPS
jgi:RNA polymerase sigma factor (sigma-70 family)